MKKIRKFLMLFLILLPLLSCTTIKEDLFSNVSLSEADYALHLALGTACEKAADKLGNQLNKTDFLPAKYNALKNTSSIPGLSTLMTRMNNYYASYIKDNIQFFSGQMKKLSEEHKFKKPVELLSTSNSSAASDFIFANRKTIENGFTEIMSKSDTDFFSSCVNQYNAFITTSNKKDGTNKPLLEKENITSFIVDKIVSAYCELLKSSEEYFRTTPDPYADETAAKVFKIN